MIDGLKGYESPIRTKAVQIYDDVVRLLDDKIMEEIVRVLNVTVDKDELVKALAYDREQYRDGYRHGYDEGYRDGYRYGCDEGFRDGAKSIYAATPRILEESMEQENDRC